MSRFLFLLFVCGFACCISKGTIAAMDGEEEGNSYGGNDSYNNGGGYSGNNGMMNGGNMRSQVRSIVDNILQLNQRGGQFYNNNNGPYNNGGYGNNNYAQYGDGSNGYQQNGNDSYQSQQQWNNGQYNNGGEQYNNSGNYQNSNEQSRNNEAIAFVDNREVNQRIEKAISELNTLKKNVNQRFSQIQKQQKNGRNGSRNNINAKDNQKNGKNTNASKLAEKHDGASSKKWKHRSKAKYKKQIFTVKNIDTRNMRTNSYLSTKSKYGSKYYAGNDGYRNYNIKSYAPKENSYLSKNESTKAGHMTYKIKSYSKNADRKTSSELAALDNKKYTVKGNYYFAHKNGCPENKCG